MFTRLTTGLVVLLAMLLVGVDLTSAAAVNYNHDESRLAHSVVVAVAYDATATHEDPSQDSDEKAGHCSACCLAGHCSTPNSWLAGVTPLWGTRIPTMQTYPRALKARAGGIATAPSLRPPQPSV